VQTTLLLDLRDSAAEGFYVVVEPHGPEDFNHLLLVVGQAFDFDVGVIHAVL
jgi:hypothetical protein